MLTKTSLVYFGTVSSNVIIIYRNNIGLLSDDPNLRSQHYTEKGDWAFLAAGQGSKRIFK